ncbi:MAG: UDP-N-acetylmuramate dehydrogenase [Candidatus Eisenbacteria bacterium]
MMQRKELERRLGDIVEGRIAAGEPIARHATLGVGGPADLMVFPKTEEELRGVLRLLAAGGIPKLVLGAGSDLIVRDGGFRGVCIRLARNLAGSKIAGDRTLEAMAGESLASILRLSRQASLSGLEFLATVPGTVGGGVATNVGAYGDSFANRLEGIDLLDGQGRGIRLGREAIEAEYRAIRLPEGAVVVRARFALEPADRDVIEEKVEKNREHRKRTQPLKEATAGCIFKNPSEWEYAGQLIDRAGLKGLRIGGAAVSTLHGNFIVNEGGATAADVLALVEEIRRRVREQSGVDLEPEVRIVGEEA